MMKLMMIIQMTKIMMVTMIQMTIMMTGCGYNHTCKESPGGVEEVDEEDNNEYGDKNDATIMMIIKVMMKLPTIAMMVRIIVTPVRWGKWMWPTK